jgi:hypothetical protein
MNYLLIFVVDEADLHPRAASADSGENGLVGEEPSVFSGLGKL